MLGNGLIAAVCCTYNRPLQLGSMIAAFQQQTYANRRLVILDDLGQYAPQAGDRWQLFSTHRRYPSLGEKRNAALDLVLADPAVQYVAIADDDDVYLPHWLAAVVNALRCGEWSAPRMVYRDTGQYLQPAMAVRDDGRPYFHAAWGMRASLLRRGYRYPAKSCGEDQDLGLQLRRDCGDPVNALGLPFPDPYFVWAYGPDVIHASATDYAAIAVPATATPLVIQLTRDYRTYPRAPLSACHPFGRILPSAVLPTPAP